MKKLVSFILAAACSASLATSAFAAETADIYKLYEKASEKLNAASYMEIQIVKTTEVTADGEFITKEKDVTSSKLAVRGGATEIETHTVYDNGDTRDVYFSDGYYYHAGYEAKTIAGDMLNERSRWDRLIEVTPELIKAGRTEELSNGNYRIHTQVKTKELADYLEKSWNEALNPTGDPAFRIRAGTLYQTDTITPDGDWVSSTYAISMWVDYENTRTRVRINGKEKLVSINEPLTVNIPSGMDSYTDVPAQSYIWS